MANKQGVHPFNICLFAAAVFHSFKLFCSILLAYIQDALFLMKGKARTCFSVVSLVLFLLILLLL